jgi:predicted transcriptional regulator
MTVGSKFHHASDKVTARVSSASRRDASGATPHLEFESYEEELAALKRRKQEITATLSTEFSKGAYLTAQMKVRGSIASERTLKDWIKVRGEMDGRRSLLVSELRDIELRMSQIKPKVKADNIAKSDCLLLQIANSLGEVESLLSRLCKKLGA